MVDWLKKHWRNPRFKRFSFLILFVIILGVILEVITVLSDIGFSDEVTTYRWWILLGAAVIGLLGVTVYDYISTYKERKDLRSEKEKLEQSNSDLNEQKESAFRLMEAYKAEAQEDIFNRLKHLAIFSIHQQDWKQRGAKIDRFRVEQRIPPETESQIGGDTLGRVTILINLGSKDNVMKGMKFIVQDPADLKKYGTIVVRECHENGSACSIIETHHPAFWSEVREALQSPDHDSGVIIAASSNVIVPNNPFRELSSENAKQLLDWLQRLEGIEL
jgi:hypothetical protein